MKKMTIDSVQFPVRRSLHFAVLLILLVVVANLSCTSEPASEPALFPEAAYQEELQLTTSDSVTVYGMLFRPQSVAPVPLVLAFHQGGASGLAEYTPIIPRLLREGFAVLTIDQRRGGDLFDGVNRTAAAFPDQDFSYCDVYPDLETVLDYALRLEGISEIIAWGSSYSATLAAQLAADYPGAVAKVLAFSPASGNVMEGCQILPIAKRIQVPALFLRPQSEMSNARIALEIETFVKLGHKAYVAVPGTHGSSMLVPERAGGDIEKTWKDILGFMRTLAPSDE